MKKVFLFPLLAFLITQGMTAQVKLGDNPQNIDPASLFELESSDQVLVITRVSTAELQAITPSMGALAYNTDEKCLFYHNGEVWVNLCEALGRAFTTDAIQNEFPTIVITPLEESINFEVGEIRSENIVDFSIGSQDIQNNSINSEKLADASVGAAELQDNAVTGRNLDFVDITLSDFVNDVPFLVQGNLVAAAIFYDNTASGLGASDIQAAIDALSSGLNDVDLRAVGDGTYVFTDSDGATTTFDLNASALRFDNTSNGFTATDVQGAIEEIQGSSSDDQEIIDFAFNETSDELTLTLENGGTRIADLGTLNQSAAEVPVAGNPSNYTPVAADVEGHLSGIDAALIAASGGNPNDELNLRFEVNGSNLELTDSGGTFQVPLAELGSDNQTAAQVDVAVSPVNYNPLSADVEGHLAGIDQALISAGSGEIPDNELITDVQLEGTDLIITEAGIDNTVSLAGLSGGTPDAQNVSFTPTGNTDSANVQDAIEELQTELDGVITTGTNPTDELNTSISFDGAFLSVTDAGGDQSIDISSVDDQIAAEVDVTAVPINYVATSQNVEAHLEGIDAVLTTLGANPTDELNTGISFDGTNLTISDAGGDRFVDITAVDNQIASEVEVAALPINYVATSQNVEAHLEGIDAVLTTLGANPTDELNTGISFDGTNLTISDAGGDRFVDITAVDNQIASEVEVAALPINYVATSQNVEAHLEGIDAVLTTLGANPTDELNTGISFDGTNLTISDAGGDRFVDITAVDNQIASEVEVAALPINYVATSQNVEAHLEGIDAAIATSVNTNLAITDLSQTGNRIYSLNGFDLAFDGSGSLGIGRPNPQSKLDVQGQIQARNGFASTAGTAGNPGYGFYTDGDTDMGMFRADEDQLAFSTFGAESMRIDDSQQVGIGIILPEALLHVGGTSIFEGTSRFDDSITLSDGSIIPDFVFEKYFLGYSNLDPDYTMLDLESVRKYIQKNYHLPGIMSALEIQENGGINLNQTLLKNLEKIEELFLHTIEQEQKIQSLEEEKEVLTQEVSELKLRLDRIEKALTQKEKN